jgi:hypothetical protein
MKNIARGWVALCLMGTCWLSACQTATAPAGSAGETTTGKKRLAPARVDIRGSVIMSRYNQGQVMLEVEGVPSPNNRYNRAYVLVEPVTQIVGPNGGSLSLSELRQGQNVAVLFRGSGQGNTVGVGVARKVWVE